MPVRSAGGAPCGCVVLDLSAVSDIDPAGARLHTGLFHTHDIAYLRQDNGEPQEDVVDKETTAGSNSEAPAEEARAAAAEEAASFPASPGRPRTGGASADQVGTSADGA